MREISRPGRAAADFTSESPVGDLVSDKRSGRAGLCAARGSGRDDSDGKGTRRMTTQALLQAATEVRENAYAPYSRFKVGAALRSASGRIYRGCNVENAAYPEGTCAEAGAIAAMVAAGETELTEVAVIADCPNPVPPCGGCRQKLAEFGRHDVKVTLATLDGATLQTTVGDLLPGSFTAGHMDGR